MYLGLILHPAEAQILNENLGFEDGTFENEWRLSLQNTHDGFAEIVPNQPEVDHTPFIYSMGRLLEPLTTGLRYYRIYNLVPGMSVLDTPTGIRNTGLDLVFI